MVNKIEKILKKKKKSKVAEQKENLLDELKKRISEHTPYRLMMMGINSRVYVLAKNNPEKLSDSLVKDIIQTIDKNKNRVIC
jgi:hypothetical protein